MGKQASKKTGRETAASKERARKPVASGKPKTAKQTTKAPSKAPRGKAAAAKKAAQRKDTGPAVKAKFTATAPKPTAKSPRPAAGSKSAVSKPSRAKAIADSKKAPAMGERAVAAKEAAREAARKAGKTTTPKAAITAVKEKPVHQPGRKTARSASAVGEVEAAKMNNAAQAAASPYEAPSEFDGFKVNDYVVYPAHGVGKIIAVETQEIAGTRLDLFVIAFEQEKMTLRVPLGKAKAVGMRILSSRDTVRTALKTLRGRARIKRTMWSRRAQEYEAKINSGDLLLIAEVVRDLHRAEGQPEQSYSERQIYEAALDRMAREVGAVEELDTMAALERVGTALQKAA